MYFWKEAVTKARSDGRHLPESVQAESSMAQKHRLAAAEVFKTPVPGPISGSRDLAVSKPACRTRVIQHIPWQQKESESSAPLQLPASTSTLAVRDEVNKMPGTLRTLKDWDVCRKS